MPSPNAIISKPLTDLSTALVQSDDKFVAAMAFPMVPVEEKSGKYYVFDEASFWRDEMKPRADGAQSAGGDYDFTTDDYAVEVEAFHRDVGPQQRANSKNPLAPDMEATSLVTQKALIRREIKWRDSYFITGKWAAANERAGNAAPTGDQFKYWSASASTPVDDVLNMHERIESKTGFRGNVMVVHPAVHRALKTNADVRGYFNYPGAPTGPGGGTIITAQMLAGLFEVEKYLVMRAVVNTAAKGQVKSIGYIGGKHAALFYAAPRPGLMTPSAGYHFAWTSYAGAGAMGTSITKETVPLTRGAERIEIEAAWQAKMVANTLGGFFLGAVA